MWIKMWQSLELQLLKVHIVNILEYFGCVKHHTIKLVYTNFCKNKISINVKIHYILVGEVSIIIIIMLNEILR